MHMITKIADLAPMHFLNLRTLDRQLYSLQLSEHPRAAFVLQAMTLLVQPLRTLHTQLPRPRLRQLWIVNHPHIRHAALGPCTSWTLLTNTRRIETHIRTRLAARIMMPLPSAIGPKRVFRLQVRAHLFADGFSDSLHRGLAELHAQEYCQHAFAGLREARLDAGEADNLMRAGVRLVE